MFSLQGVLFEGETFDLPPSLALRVRGFQQLRFPIGRAGRLYFLFHSLTRDNPERHLSLLHFSAIPGCFWRAPIMGRLVFSQFFYALGVLVVAAVSERRQPA